MGKTRKNPRGEERDGEGAVGTGNSRRLALMQEINDRNDAAMAESGDLMGVSPDGESTTAFDFGEAEASEASEAPEVEAQAAQPQRFRVKVNGQEREVTLDELTERYQREAGADQKFEEAARMRAEAGELRRQRDEEEQARLSEQDAARSREERRRLTRAIQMGSEEEAEAAIAKIQADAVAAAEARLSGKTLSGVSLDEISQTIDARLSFNEAVNSFKHDFPEIVADRRLSAMAAQRDAELVAAGDKRGFAERYRAIGGEIREWRKSLLQPEQAAQQEERERQELERKKREKAAAGAPPRGAAAKAPAAEEEEDREESVQEVIANMAKARGGPQWLRG